MGEGREAGTNQDRGDVAGKSPRATSQLRVLVQVPLPLDPQCPHLSKEMVLPSPWGGVRGADMVEKVPAEPWVRGSPRLSCSFPAGLSAAA